MTDEQAEQANNKQLERARRDTFSIWDTLDGKGLDLEKLAELPDLRPE